MSKRITLLTLCTVFAWLGGGVGAAQSPEPGRSTEGMRTASPSMEDMRTVGRFPLRYYAPAEHGLARNNTHVAQTPDGLIYVANAKGILVYDGHTWTPVVDPLLTGVQALSYGFDGRLYVAAEGHPGYLAPDERGHLRFHSLAEHLPAHYQALSTLWEVSATLHGVYFTAHEGALLRWDGQTLHVIEAESPFFYHNVIDGEVYTSDVQGRVLRVAPTGKIEVLHRLDGTIGRILPDGPDGLLLFISGRPLLRCSREADRPCEAWSTEADDLILMGKLYAGARLADGTLALGFDGEGVALLDDGGRVLRHLGVEAGLHNTEVMELNQTTDGALWASLFGGMARIDASRQRTEFARAEGVESAVSQVLRHDGRLYAATEVGFVVLDETVRPARFVPVQTVDRHVECKQLTEVGTALIGLCNSGLLRIEDEAATVVWEPSGGVRLGTGFVRSEHDPGQLFVPSESTLYAFEVDERGEVSVVDSLVTDHVLFNLGQAPRSPGATETVLWSTTTNQRAVVVSIPDGSALRDAHVWPTLQHSELSIYSRLVHVDGVLHMVGRTATYEASLTTEGPRLEPARTAWAGEVGVPAFLRERPGTTRWFTGADNALYVASSHGTSGYGEPQRILAPEAARTIAALTFDQDGTGWLATETGVVRLDAALTRPPAPALRLRRVMALAPDSLVADGFSDALRHSHTLAPDRNALRFSFAALAYEQPSGSTYRVRLDGLAPRWSEWTSETQKDYTNLDPGSYTFRVQARDGYGQVTEEATFSFRLLPTWYQTWWASLLWACSGIAGFVVIVVGYNRHRSRRLHARTALLEAAVAERTAEIRQQKQEVERQRTALEEANLELHDLNHTLEGRTVELRQALEQNKEFLGVAAHDLKNPLGGIAGLADLLIDERDTMSEAEQVESLKTIRAEAIRAAALITDLLDDAQRETQDGLRLRVRQADLAGVARSVARWNRVQALQKHISLELAVPEQLPARVDVSALQRAMDNLVSNAVKYSPLGSCVWVSLLVESVPSEGDGQRMSWARFAVSDQGPGLTEADKAKVFGKLERLSAQPTGGEHSTGLGLYIAKTLVEAHGGTIGVESEAGAGATFWFRLPLEPQTQGDVELSTATLPSPA
ncbi:MAG: ATP-binding protein [Bacteroidota bacterium]